MKYIWWLSRLSRTAPDDKVVDQKSDVKSASKAEAAAQKKVKLSYKDQREVGTTPLLRWKGQARKNKRTFSKTYRWFGWFNSE